MEEYENYIRRTTYGTPENIRIRRFYNRLNNRPLNYGMEDLFPNVESYTSQPMTAVNNTDWQNSLQPQPLPDFSQAAPQVRYPDLNIRDLYPVVQTENGTAGINYSVMDVLPSLATFYNLGKIKADYSHYAPLGIHDKFKHAAMNCHAAQNGYWGNQIISGLSGFKEFKDVYISGNNEREASDEDMAANLIGRYLGNRYPRYDCENMISHYISRKYPRR